MTSANKAPEPVLPEVCLALTLVAQIMVDHPEAIRVTAEDLGASVLFTLHAAPGDVGQLIGMGGRTARSLRMILTASGKKYGRSFALDIPTAPARD